VIAVAAETPLQDDVRVLVAELNETLLALTPPEFCFHMTVEQMAEPTTTLFVARDDGAAVACGALKRHEDGVGEVKRMYTRPSHRGRRIGAVIVAAGRPQAAGAGDRRPPSRRLGGLRARRLHALRVGARLSRVGLVGVLREGFGARMIERLVLATVMVGFTVTVHFFGLLALLWILRARAHAVHDTWVREGAAIFTVVLGLMVIHAMEVWLYAGVYLALGALNDLETALYFSTASFTTIGYGDVVLDQRWRLVGAIEGANGLLLFGWSTAFLFSVISRMRTLEHDWLERGPK